MNTNRRNQEGTSLIEVLAAMTLFAIVASGVAAMAANSLRATAHNRQAGMAQMLAQEELESIRGLAYSDIAPSSRTTVVNNQLYHIDTEVLANSPASGMSEITVAVTWESPIGSRSYEIETIFTAIRGES
jgi:prepilin-type N-terminal cleavage/methylation domain-containing protein